MFGGLFGGDGDEEDEERAEGRPIEEERKNEIERILSRYDQRFETEMGGGTGRVESREYKEYKEAEEVHSRKNWYERMVGQLGFFEFEVDGLQEDLEDAVEFLGWDVKPSKVFPSALVISVLALIIVVATVFILPSVPLVFRASAFLIPLVVLYYLSRYPVFRARSKVITSSDDMILAVLYMIIYLRNSPSLEGALRFAALNTEGTISKDLKRVIWETEVGNYTSMQEAFMDYARRWKTYNQDFVESVEILREVTLEGSQERREELLEEAINNLLEGTRQRMKRYARELKMPVSVLVGMGIILPVLGIILFPMVASFMGSPNLGLYLAFTYNIVIPLAVYGIIQQILLKRPPTISTEQVESGNLPREGYFSLSIGSRSFSVPALVPALVMFLVLVAWPALYYSRVLLGEVSLPPSPSLTHMARSILATVAVGTGVGSYYYLGSFQRERKLREVRKVEEEFPEALFQLGNALRRGTPVEIGVKDAVENMGNLEISSLFERISYNIQETGMTFEEAIFDPEYGALRHYPSKLVESVMRAVTESAGKGTEVVSNAMTTISSYLKDIHRTQGEIEENLSDTLSTMSFLIFILAPVISGVALALGTIITKSFALISEISERGANVTTGGQIGGPSIVEAFNLGEAIPPDVIQAVVGLYLIQLAFLIGMFHVRLSRGRNPTLRRMFTAKILIVAPIIYAVTALVLLAVFGNMITGVMA